MANDLTAIRAQYSDGEYLDAYPREACATILALCDEVDRLRTIIDNLHHVEQKHRDTANDQFHRANKLRAENEQLMEALALIGAMGYSKDPAVNANIARMAVTQAREARALAQKGGEWRRRGRVAQKGGE